MSATGPALTALLENLSEGVCLIGADGRVSAANRRFSELLDLPADSLRKGKRAASLANLPERLAQLLAKFPAEPLSEQIETPGGRILEVRASPDDSGGHLVSLTDISELHRLRSKDELMRGALDAIADGFGIFDPDDRLVIMNQRYLGYSPEEGDRILGITFDDLMRQDRRHRFYPEVVGHETPFIEARIEAHREGAGRPINFRIAGAGSGWAQARDYKLADGSTVVVRSDVSELVERDRALRESQASLATAQRVAHLGSWELDLTGGDRLTWSDETYRIFGYKPGEVPASNELFFRLVHPDDVERVKTTEAEALAKGLSYSLEHRVIRPDGSEIVVHERSEIILATDGKTPLKVIGTVQDITGQKRAEAALQANQERLDLALQTAKAAYWELDLSTSTHNLSTNYFAMLGYSQAEAPKGREGWLSLLHPDDVGGLGDNQTLPPHDRSNHEFEFRIRARDGSWRWILSRFRAMAFDNLGRPTRLLGIDLDNTVRKQGELALHQARERAQRYLDIAGAIIVVLDTEHRVTLLNRKGCEILGISEREALGRNWFDAFSPDEERETQRATYAAYLSGKIGPAQDIEMTVKTASGAVRLVAWHDNMIRDAEGRVIGAISSGEDITEQRAAERKRDEFRTLLEAMSEASPDGILITDAEGRYLFWNQRLMTMWGLSPEYVEARRRTASDADPSLSAYTRQVLDRHTFIGEILRAYDQSQPPQTSFADIALKDGRIFVRHAARVAPGKLPYTIVAWIYRDVTEQRKKDAVLAQAQRLTTVGELSGGMAHELNNLLMIIGGNLELIEIQAQDKRDASAKFARTAYQAVERGAELIRHLLAFSRKQPLAPKLTDVNAFVTDSIKMLQRLLGESVAVKFAPGANLWPTVIDQGLLQTALVSLGTNARDAMPKGGSLVIETSNEILDETHAGRFADVSPGEYILITVTDTGAGMPADIAKRAFEPFFTTKPVGKGTGLGLSVVYGFVKQSGGHVAIYSEEGRGTTVRVYLRRASEEARARAETPLAPVARGNKETILLVEDEAPVMAVARAFLTDLGYQVLEASTGVEALGILSSDEPIDLLFTDVVLPDGMNGAEVAKAAEGLRPGLKVLFASGYTKEALVYQGRLESGVTLLPKPYRKRDLAEAIRAVL
jgi:two-component system cell cycle sensor histidine kinase/response regulator CckA